MGYPRHRYNSVWRNKLCLEVIVSHSHNEETDDSAITWLVSSGNPVENACSRGRETGEFSLCTLRAVGMWNSFCTFDSTDLLFCWRRSVMNCHHQQSNGQTCNKNKKEQWRGYLVVPTRGVWFVSDVSGVLEWKKRRLDSNLLVFLRHMYYYLERALSEMYILWKGTLSNWSIAIQGEIEGDTRVG